ncbi:MAG: ribonuclease HII [Gemmatimonadota bacterium]|nr:ribonuclease HII [Gemmatimonadota bacterium]
MRKWSAIERDLRSSRGALLAGVDEVGRGPLAGPVVACAVVMPTNAKSIRGVDDSKTLRASERDKLAARIRERALCVSVGAASVREVDRYNIYHASVLAIRRAITRLSLTPDHVVIDGLTIRTLGIEHTAVVGGDARCHSIACASIVAKVTRDRLMHALAVRHPHYHWETNVGYGTREHRAGLDAHGLTAHHRRSFAPVSQLSLALSFAPEDEASALADALFDALEQCPSLASEHS